MHYNGNSNGIKEYIANKEGTYPEERCEICDMNLFGIG
jgi:hypothetical protein